MNICNGNSKTAKYISFVSSGKILNVSDDGTQLFVQNRHDNNLCFVFWLRMRGITRNTRENVEEFRKLLNGKYIEIRNISFSKEVYLNESFHHFIGDVYLKLDLTPRSLTKKIVFMKAYLLRYSL